MLQQLSLFFLLYVNSAIWRVKTFLSNACQTSDLSLVKEIVFQVSNLILCAYKAVSNVSCCFFVGLELPLRHAKVGQIFRIHCASKFAYGDVGRPAIKAKSGTVPAIPPNAALEFDVELKEIILEETVNAMPELERNRYVVSFRKEVGNRWYSYGDYTRAGRAYSEGVKAAEAYFKKVTAPPGDDVASDDPYKKILDQYAEQEGSQDHTPVTLDQPLLTEYINCLNNLAQCFIFKNELVKAKEVCLRVLELDRRNVKGLFRAAKVALATHEYDDCDLCLRTLKDLDPTNPALSVEEARLKKAKQMYKAREKEMASNMAHNLFKHNK